MLGTNCLWQIDLGEARTWIAQLNSARRLAGGWAPRRLFDERLSDHGSLLSRMSETRARAAAEEALDLMDASGKAG